MLHEPLQDSDDAAREGMSGNICRCGAYSNIVAAVRYVQSPEGLTVHNFQYSTSAGIQEAIAAVAGNPRVSGCGTVQLRSRS